MNEKKEKKDILVDLGSLSSFDDDLSIYEDKISEAQKIFVAILKRSSIQKAARFWIMNVLKNGSYNPETIENYRRYLEDLFFRGILPIENSLGETFCVDELHFNRNRVIDSLLQEKSLSDNEKRYRLNALIAFSKFLEVKTLGFFKKLECPSKLTQSSTDRISPVKMLTSAEYNSLRRELWKISERDGLVIDLIYFCARPLRKILSMAVDEIKLENKQVLFKGSNRELIPVNINDQLAIDLMKYLEDTKGQRKDSKNLFITNNGKPIFRTRFTHVLKKASQKADLGFVATTKMIQKSFITEHFNMGLSEENIMKKFNLNNLEISGED